MSKSKPLLTKPNTSAALEQSDVVDEAGGFSAQIVHALSSPLTVALLSMEALSAQLDSSPVSPSLQLVSQSLEEIQHWIWVWHRHISPAENSPTWISFQQELGHILFLIEKSVLGVSISKDFSCPDELFLTSPHQFQQFIEGVVSLQAKNCKELSVCVTRDQQLSQLILTITTAPTVVKRTSSKLFPYTPFSTSFDELEKIAQQQFASQICATSQSFQISFPVI